MIDALCTSRKPKFVHRTGRYMCPNGSGSHVSCHEIGQRYGASVRVRPPTALHGLGVMRAQKGHPSQPPEDRAWQGRGVPVVLRKRASSMTPPGEGPQAAGKMG